MMVSTVKIWVGTLPKTNVDIVNEPIYMYIYIYIYIYKGTGHAE